MTPYVANDKDSNAGVKKPRSIMVHPTVNGNAENSPDERGLTITGDSLNGELDATRDESSGDGDSIKPLLNGNKGRSLTNGNRTTKAGALKRVSFGSSKGSMVETLVYDHNDEVHPPSHSCTQTRFYHPGVGPHVYQQQSSNVPTTTQPLLSDRLKDDPRAINNSPPLVNGHDDSNELEPLFANWQLILGPDETPENCEEVGGVLVPSKVKVSFFESQKPICVTTPESPDIPLDFLNISVMSTSPGEYQRQQSTDSGLDNPFRPDGELSREADTIVSLIKEGKPITPVKSEADGGGYFPIDDQVNEAVISPAKAKNVENSAANNKVGANGNAPRLSLNDKKVAVAQPGVVEVQHGVVVPPSDASQVEQVVIKKKPKCKCCVIQ